MISGQHCSDNQEDSHNRTEDDFETDPDSCEAKRLLGNQISDSGGAAKEDSHNRTEDDLETDPDSCEAKRLVGNQISDSGGAAKFLDFLVVGKFCLSVAVIGGITCSLKYMQTAASRDLCPENPVFGGDTLWYNRTQSWKAEAIKALSTAQNFTYIPPYAQQVMQDRTPFRYPPNMNNRIMRQKFHTSLERYGPSDRPNGLRIAFVGDSISRFHSLALMHWLHTGYWATDDLSDNDINVLGDHVSKNHFFNMTREFFGHDKVLCDCYGVNNTILLQELVENRYYHDDCRDNHVYFIGKYGKIIRGLHSIDDVNNRARYQNFPFPPLGGGSNTFAWDYSNLDWTSMWSAIIRHIASIKPKPKYVVINEGHWVPNTLNTPEVLKTIREELDHFKMIGIYRSTTIAKKDGIPVRHCFTKEHDIWGCQRLHYCILTTWTQRLRMVNSTDEHCYDDYHFRPHVNTWLSEQLLDLVLKDIGENHAKPDQPLPPEVCLPASGRGH